MSTLKRNDPVAFSTTFGEVIHGQFIGPLDADIILVRVGNQNVRVAKTACWKVEEVAVMQEARGLMTGLAVVAVLIGIAILLGKLFL